MIVEVECKEPAKWATATIMRKSQLMRYRTLRALSFLIFVMLPRATRVKLSDFLRSVEPITATIQSYPTLVRVQMIINAKDN